MKITAEFNNTEELLSFINTFGTKTIEEPKAEPTNKRKPKKEETPKEEPKTEPKEEQPKENVETKTAGVDEVPTTDPIGANNTDEKTYTKKEVQDICKNKIKEGKQLEVKAIIAKHGAKNISSIAEEEYAAVIAEVEVL